MHGDQGCNLRKNLGATFAMGGRSPPPGGDRVKVSENLGATEVALGAPVDTSLVSIQEQIMMVLV